FRWRARQMIGTRPSERHLAELLEWLAFDACDVSLSEAKPRLDNGPPLGRLAHVRALGAEFLPGFLAGLAPRHAVFVIGVADLSQFDVAVLRIHQRFFGCSRSEERR